ncbi:hypothetical protein J5X98_18530 [Leptothermofonsia sichuanensis E412]|uniref:hypothetical protein n=1 Tax=Leptothermofonsia sichuanensis TaxID=2917832 RepID=UPI001CA6EC0A|nr:hypothetical protein [Leptothermofonsia sichuanensis]QZZ19367.1 hypothetical protein J5X98_18530 [Leptothermofonsia sichuanensis E412]
MNILHDRKVLIAIATSIGLLASGSALVYWQHLQRQWCVQFTSSNRQEVRYSRGCYSPKRYKQWTITAMR